MDTNSLRKFGLSENEIKVYIASLELGTATVNTIADRADLPRTTTYDVLKSLEEKGLAGYVIKKGIKHFKAANPTKMISILKEKEVSISRILPDLLAISKSVKEKPKIEIYEGKEGLKTILDDLIETKKPIFTFSSTRDLITKLPFYFPGYITRRTKARIPVRVITEETKETKELVKKGKKEYREMRFVPKKFEFPNAIYMYGNKIAMLDLKGEVLGIIIEDEDLNETFRLLFEIIWESQKTRFK